MTRRKLSRLRRLYNAQRRARFAARPHWHDMDAGYWRKHTRSLPTHRDERGFWYYGMPSGYGALPHYVGPWRR